MNYESGLPLPKLGVGVLPQGKQARTCTLKFLPGVTVYEIGTAEPNHTRCTRSCIRIIMCSSDRVMYRGSPSGILSTLAPFLKISFVRRLEVYRALILFISFRRKYFML